MALRTKTLAAPSAGQETSGFDTGAPPEPQTTRRRGSRRASNRRRGAASTSAAPMPRQKRGAAAPQSGTITATTGFGTVQLSREFASQFGQKLASELMQKIAGPLGETELRNRVTLIEDKLDEALGILRRLNQGAVHDMEQRRAVG